MTPKTIWPFLLGLVSLALWAGYALIALSATTSDWVPAFLRLPFAAEDRAVIALRGQFGDAFGAFNALVSTFALIGLFFTIRSQQTQIGDQERAHRSSELLTRQQQFQEQYYRAIDAYKDLLSNVSVADPDSDYGRPDRVLNGRNALWAIWRHQFIKTIATVDGTSFDDAIKKQLDAYLYENLGRLNANRESVRAIASVTDEFHRHPELRQEGLHRIGVAWNSVYNIHRFQLDSLFRSWYTAYRVLETAKMYDVSADAIRLYSAVFRAQLSWIEMAFLLVNQSGLPDNPCFPKACSISNRYSLFDNLDIEHDTVVAILHLEATTLKAISPSTSNDRNDDGGKLCETAFRSPGQRDESVNS
jgi:hypothetical protein